MSTPEADETGTLASVGKSLIDRLLRIGINGAGQLKSAEECAREAMSGERSQEQAIRSLIRTHVAMAGAQGFVLNLGGLTTSLVALPANISGAYIIQTRLAASIARVHGHALDTEEVRTAIVLCLLGNNAAEVLKQAGVRIGQQLTAKLIKQIPMRVIRDINRRVGFRLLTKAGLTGTIVLAKGIPLVGGAVGGGFDAMATRAVGEFARRFLGPEGVSSPDHGRSSASGSANSGEVAAARRRGPLQRLTALRAAVGPRSRRTSPAVPPKTDAVSTVVEVTVGWGLIGANDVTAELESSAFMCRDDGRVQFDRDFVYHDNPSSADGSVQYAAPEDDDAGDHGWAKFTVDLSAMPDHVESVVFALAIHDAELSHLTFSSIGHVYLQARDRAGSAEPVRHDLVADQITDTVVVLGELDRRDHTWQLRAIGQGYPGGLASVAKHFGVNV